PPTMRSFVFRGKGGETRVAWSLEPTVLRVRAAKPFTVADLMGQTRTVEPADGLAVLPVRRGEPVYLVGDVDQVDAGLTVRVDRKCSACVGEMALVPYRIENAFPFPVSVGLEGGGARQQATVKPDSVEQGRVALPPDTAPGKKVLAFHVRTGGELLAEMPVEIRADNRLAFPQPPHMADDATMRLMLRNASREQSLSIDRILWTAGLAEGVREVSLSIAPGEEVSLAIPEVRLEPYAVVPLCVEGRLGGEFLGGWQGIIGDNPVHRLTPTMDGNLDEWEDLPAIDLRKHGTVKMTQDGGPADLSGKLWLAHDERNFYLAARITDDAHHPPVEENDIGDQIEFVVSPMPPWQAAARYWPGEGFYRFAVSLRASGPQVYQMKGVSEDEGQSLAEGAVCRARREGMETIYEVSIPREGRELFTPGCPYFSLSLLVRDRDGPDRGGWIEWGSGFAKGKRRERFHLCRLGKR
ncbi:MAG TPA: hypothetical protein DCX07_06665, partial [Phycisphaerales bacterium]|nr:hypothetical protein [Phycisphaerales bacterium]